MYIDIDTLSFAPVQWFEKLKNYDGVNGKWTPAKEEMTIGEGVKVNISFLSSFYPGILGPWRAGSDLAMEWSENQDALLRDITKKLREHKEKPEEHKYPLEWAQLGGQCILPYAARTLPSRRYFSYDGTVATTQWTIMSRGPVKVFYVVSLRYCIVLQLSDLKEPGVNWTITFQPTTLLTFLHALVRDLLDPLTLEELFSSRTLLIELLARAAANCMNKVKKPSKITVGANAQLVADNATVMQYLKGLLRDKGV